jgi:hypothetical protein
MSAAPPINFTWTGEVMEPHRRFHNICASAFVIGEVYPLVEYHDRTTKTHNHFFASLVESWKNLPEDLAQRFDTSEKLRKYALIKCGYADIRQHVCASKAEAQRFAAFIRPMDEYAIIVASESVVTVYTAQSQSKAAMGAKAFQESKSKVLDFVAALIGVSQSTLAQNAGRAA